MAIRKHIVLVPFFIVSHYRSAVGLAINLVQSNEEVAVTVLINKIALAPVLQMVERVGLTNGERLRVIGVVGQDPPPGPQGLFALYHGLAEELPVAYKTIASGCTLTCVGTGAVFDFGVEGLPRPSAHAGRTGWIWGCCL